MLPNRSLFSATLCAPTLWALLLVAVASHAEDIPRTPAPEGVHLYLISPAAGETVKSPVTFRFGLAGMGVAPAGVRNPKTGHHHLIIDAPLPAFDLPLPNDGQHRHFGGGQTQATLDLPAGKHTLQLILGDVNHVPFDPPIVSEQIWIEVE